MVPGENRGLLVCCPTQEAVVTGLHALWLPILLSAVIVFVASSLIHMVSPWHKNDYPRMQNEDKVMDALRPLALPPGDYLIPRPRPGRTCAHRSLPTR